MMEIRNIYRARLRMRPDLVCREQTNGTQQAWVLKDPISLRYFTLTQQEFAILQWLDGSNSLHDIRRKFEDAFPPQRITPQHLQSFFANLYENGLIVADAPDQGSILLENRERQQRRERWQTVLNWLAIRLPVFDPDRLLAWLEPRFRWFFSRTYLFACVLFSLFALGFVAFHASEFRAQLPEMKELVSPQNLLWMAVAFAAAKILHEFGHALTCKHFGGECHEMGLMLLLFVPCLYCNVTDSWMLQSRWHRIAVSAAGMIVEFQLASLAVFVWWFTEPGIIHAIALNTMVVCTVGTLFFNGNPLLRYDGYFILVDLLGIPNLWQESRLALKTQLSKWFLQPDFVPRTDPDERRWTLIAYAVASIVYRVFIMLAIVLFLQRLLLPKGLGVLIPVIVATFIVSAAVFWFIALRRFWSKPMAWRQFRALRILYATAAVVAAGWLLLCVPFPCRISAPALLQPIAAQRVYVSTPGVLSQCVAPGNPVAANQEIARLDDVKLHRDVVRLTGELHVAQSRVEGLQARANGEPDVAAQLEVAKQMLVDVRQQLQQRQKDEQALTLTAPIAGIVMEPPEAPQPSSADLRLPAWDGTPLEARNKQCYLERGTLVCLVGDPASQEAVVFVDENDVRYIRQGQQVRLKFAVAPSAILNGRIVEIAKQNVLAVPRELAIDQELPNRPDSTGVRRPTGTSYTVRVAIEDQADAQLLTAARGQAKIVVEPQSLGERLLRGIRRTFTVNL